MTVLCPRCGVDEYTPYGETATRSELKEHPYPALSRLDNKTYICTACGTDEAMLDFSGKPPIPPDEWPIGRRMREVQ